MGAAPNKSAGGGAPNGNVTPLIIIGYTADLIPIIGVYMTGSVTIKHYHSSPSVSPSIFVRIVL